MSSTRPEKTEHFVALDGMRGIAAVFIVQWHGYLGGPRPAAGYLAVDFFFLLSGWVLAHAYDQRLAGGLSTLSFLRIRLIRLYPVYLLAIGVTTAVSVANGHFLLPSMLTALLLLPDFWSPYVTWLIPPAWSLAAELLANTPFALFHRYLTSRVLIVVIALAYAGLVVTVVVNDSLDAGTWGGSWLAMLPRVFFSFPLGVLLYRHRQKLAKWAPKRAIWPAFQLLIAFLCIPAAHHHQVRDLAIVCLLLPALLLFASNAQPGTHSAGIARALGVMSYPLYLLHIPAFDAINAVLRPLLGRTLDAGPPVLGAVAFAGLLMLAFAVDRFYDRPIRGWLSSLTALFARAPEPLAAPATRRMAGPAYPPEI